MPVTTRPFAITTWEQAAQIDFAKLFRFARELNAHQLKAACQWLAHHHATISTELFIEYLRTMRLSSNVDLGEVQPVNLHDLKGVEEVIRSLEANIIVPLENDELASELNLKPKRGVLLAGPPGTGKRPSGQPWLIASRASSSCWTARSSPARRTSTRRSTISSRRPSKTRHRSCSSTTATFCLRTAKSTALASTAIC